MWQLLFWVSTAVIVYTYFGYPAALFVIGKYAADKFTILVASDGSDDDTVSIAEEYADSGIVVRHWPRRRGKSTVLNDVVAGLDHDVVVFTDANTAFAADAVERLVRRFADPAIGCVVGKLRYVEGDPTSVGRGESVYWRYEGWISGLESRLESVLVAAGSIFAIRRGLFRELFPGVANDFQIPFDIARQGKGVVYEPHARADEHTTSRWQEEFDRKVRIVLRGLTGYAALRGRIRGFRLWQFWSHKMLRWMVGFFLFAAFGSNMVLAEDSLFFTLTLAVQVVFYLAALGGWMNKGAVRPRRALYVPFYFTMVNGSGVIAVIKFLMGHRQSVWEKAESTRLHPVPVAHDLTPGQDDHHDVGARVAKS
jgi:cellulose synthase/poly-beta-1,6-N-acetylglucosamine synthase-like glycosyltransferase